MKIKRFEKRKAPTVFSSSTVNNRFVDPLNKLWAVQQGAGVSIEKKLPCWKISIDMPVNMSFGNIRIKNFSAFINSLGIIATPDVHAPIWDGVILPRQYPNAELEANNCLVNFQFYENGNGFEFALIPTVLSVADIAAGVAMNDWYVWNLRDSATPFGVYTFTQNEVHPIYPITLELETF